MLVQPEQTLAAAQILQKRKRETQGVGLAIFAQVNASSPLLCPPQELERGIHKPGVDGMAVIFAIFCWYPLLLRGRPMLDSMTPSSIQSAGNRIVVAHSNVIVCA